MRSRRAQRCRRAALLRVHGAGVRSGVACSAVAAGERRRRERARDLVRALRRPAERRCRAERTQPACWSCGMAEPSGDDPDPPGPSSAANDGAGLKRVFSTARASEIEPVRMQCLWQDRIAVGSITVVAGVPGSRQVDARARTGGSGHTRGARSDYLDQSADVIVSSAEDRAAATLVPRLIAAGADRDRVHFPRVSKSGLRVPLDLARDAEDSC